MEACAKVCWIFEYRVRKLLKNNVIPDCKRKHVVVLILLYGGVMFSF